MEDRDCPNCSAPVHVPLGEVEAICEYCGSHLRFIPDQQEMEVVHKREEMKYRERVTMQKALLKKQMDQEEMERWRRMAGRVALQALPVVGDAAGRALFRAALGGRRRRRGGCGCLVLLVPALAVTATVLA